MLISFWYKVGCIFLSNADKTFWLICNYIMWQSLPNHHFKHQATCFKLCKVTETINATIRLDPEWWIIGHKLVSLKMLHVVLNFATHLGVKTNWKSCSYIGIYFFVASSSKFVGCVRAVCMFENGYLGFGVFFSVRRHILSFFFFFPTYRSYLIYSIFWLSIQASEQLL